MNSEHRQRVRWSPGASLAERFWSNVEKSGAHGCWLWTGSFDLDGYGRVMVARRNYKAHRLSYEFAHGPISPGLCVCHRCDVFVAAGDASYRRCVNPDHLFLGTSSENTLDKVAKSRQPRGSGHANAKLTEEEVLEIWAQRSTGRLQREIGRQFGVTGECVWQIWNGRSWRHLNLAPEARP